MRIAMTLALLLVLSPTARAMDVDPEYRLKQRLERMAITALSKNEAESKNALAALRAAGPRGLEAMFTIHWAAIERHRANPKKTEPMWPALTAALDTVAAQKDAWAANLYWYTDLDQAKAAATQQSKPILSLRLLGTLDTEFSCANSRYFRTVLYANKDLGDYLRANYVLHWKSHRPVPKLTIDFGDGRTIERTITGNSAHYVLTPRGDVVDAIPGLYGPVAFKRQIDKARKVAFGYLEKQFASILEAYHREQLAETARTWADDLSRIGVDAKTGAPMLQGKAVKFDAVSATRVAASKSAMEIRPVLAIVPDRNALAKATDDGVWTKIAALHADDAKLDAGSRAVMLSKADAVAANDLTRSKKRVEDPFVRMMRNFERSVAEDTVRNEYILHGQVHQWFVEKRVPATFDEINEKVYAELFLMPRSDPFLGLVADDTYTALPGK